MGGIPDSARSGSPPIRPAILLAALIALAVTQPTPAAAQTLVAEGTDCGRPGTQRTIASVQLYRFSNVGYQLRVTPTVTGRSTANQNPEIVWDAVRRCAPRHPAMADLLNATTIRQQFDCHAFFATIPGRTGWAGGPTWDLERWRPARSSLWSWILTLPPCGAEGMSL